MTAPDTMRRMRVPLTPHGLRELIVLGGGLLVVAAVALHYGGWPFALVPLLLAAFVVSFFRDPDRAPPTQAELLAAPADGTVADIERVTSAEYVDEPALRIGIFLSVFNVHVNRSPASGIVRYLRYQPGRFLDARDPRAGVLNESNSLGLEANGVRLLVRQVSGLIARRIVCPVLLESSLAKGERFGMIKFGSRTELYVPISAGVEALVRVGQSVRGGETPIASVAAWKTGARTAPEVLSRELSS
jgi:phosphatidylserine decarboxylase